VMKYYKLIIKNFDQVKKHNFDQVNFGQVIISQLIDRAIKNISKNHYKDSNFANGFNSFSKLFSGCCRRFDDPHHVVGQTSLQEVRQRNGPTPELRTDER
jgi:hypothetical protein